MSQVYMPTPPVPVVQSSPGNGSGSGSGPTSLHSAVTADSYQDPYDVMYRSPVASHAVPSTLLVLSVHGSTSVEMNVPDPYPAAVHKASAHSAIIASSPAQLPVQPHQGRSSVPSDVMTSLPPPQAQHMDIESKSSSSYPPHQLGDVV